MMEDEYKEFCEEHPVLGAFFERNDKAKTHFMECHDCKHFTMYDGDNIPYGKCKHPKRPVGIPCKLKKEKIKGEYLGIKIPELKK